MGQTSFSLGGPVGHGRQTHFFTAAEYTREDKASPIISPIAPGSFTGRYRGWLGFLCLDHQINERNSVFLRGDLDAFFDTNPNGIVGGNSLPSVDRVFRRRTYSAAIGETAVFSPNLLNNVRLQFQLASPSLSFTSHLQHPIPSARLHWRHFYLWHFAIGSASESSVRVERYRLLCRGTQRNQDRRQYTGVSHGRRQQRIRRSHLPRPVPLQDLHFGLSYCESAAYLGNLANVQTYTQSYGNASYTVNDVFWSAFLQDDLRLHPDLTVNLGFRYERQTFTDFDHGFAPRIGFSYNVAGNGKTVIRGGFGIYYSQIPDNSDANYALTGPTGVFNYSAAPGQIGFPAGITAVPLPCFPSGAAVPLRTLYVRPVTAPISISSSPHRS